MSNDSFQGTVAYLPPCASSGISPFGFVIQTLRLNSLYCSDGYGALGIRPRYAEDWCRQLCLSVKARSALTTKIPATSILAPMWQPSVWQVFDGAAIHWRPYLRMCPECLKTGYHSMLFQMPWVNQCPWHLQLLTSQCQHCSRPLWRSFCSDAQPLLCPCGHDPVRGDDIIESECRFGTIRASQIERYLKWAKESRHRRTVFGIADDLMSLDATAMLLPNSSFPWYRSQRAPRGLLTRKSTVFHPVSAKSHSHSADFSLLASSLGPAHDFFLELPRSLEKPVARITASVASKFHESSFSARERACLGLPETTDCTQTFSRASVVLLPAYRVGERLFLDGRVLARPTQSVLREIALAIALLPPDSLAIEAYARAYARILGRGFAGSALHVLSKLEGLPINDKAKLLYPFALIRRRRRASYVTLAWLDCTAVDRKG